MKIAVLGSGMQGSACAYDALQNPAVEEIALADADVTLAERTKLRLRELLPHATTPITTAQLDATRHDALVAFLKPYDVAISAVPYFLNLGITRAAIEAGTHLVDMGGNTDVVFAQRELHSQAQAAGVTILPDCGLAPGMANILAAHAIARFESVDSVHIRVGGLPQHPKPPLDYQLFFSIHGLINEYVGQSVVLREGKITTVPTLTEVETIEFDAPVGTCEAFHTLGGISTLPWTYEGRIRTLDYKTIRYPGHCKQIQTMYALGLFEETPVTVNGVSMRPRDVFAAVAVPRLTFEDNQDVVLVRLEVTGQKDGHAERLTYEIVDRYDETTGLTAMMRTTAFPVSIVAQMLGDGTIAERGVLALETAIPTEAFMQALPSRNIRVSERVSSVPVPA